MPQSDLAMILNRIFTDREFGPIMVRKNSRSRSISIRVRASEGRTGCRISVTVPYSRTLQDGIDYLNTRRDWVREALKKQEKVNASAQIHDGFVMRTLLSQIVFRPSGEIPPVLPLDVASARRLSFKVRTSVIDNPQDSGRLWLSLDKPTHIRIIEVPAGFSEPNVVSQKALRDVLVEVLREEAKILLPQKLSYFSDQYGFHFHKVTIKHNSSNWGSCSRAGNINLNLNLIRLPEPLCDYVLLHELCHLKEPNHGPRFHALLERLCLSNIRHLIDLGSPDAMKYRAWIDNLDASDSSATSTSSSFFRLFKPSSSRPSMTPLNEVLSREISKWRLL
uniref:M48 family metallopeptidase n=1 Tax=Candidatus Cryptobacteroides bacterium TaxID=3085639 RepID=UPI0040271498